MFITSETCRANSVIKTALNNLHQAGPNKTHTHKTLCHTIILSVCTKRHLIRFPSWLLQPYCH